MGMLKSKIRIKIIKKARREDIVRLYKAAGWWKPWYSPAFVDRLARSSFCFVGAFDKGSLVGMARSISDGISDAYILDTVVLKQYRGRGIGVSLVKALIKYIKARGIDWVTVIAEPGTEKFYRKAGFRIMKDFTPMIIIKRKK